MKPKICPICGKQIVKPYGTKKYCSYDCYAERNKRKELQRQETLKLTKKPKAKKPSISIMKKKAWYIFSKFIRSRDCLKTTGTLEEGRCITCGEIYPFSKLQAGHYVDGRTKPVLFNPDIVHAQCVGCNIFKKGNKDSYTPAMIEMYGYEKTMEFLELRHDKDKVWTRDELERVIDIYEYEMEKILDKEEENNARISPRTTTKKPR